MLGHLGINVPDLVAARAYYDVVMPLVGYEPYISRSDEFAYMPAAGKRGTYVFFYAALDAGPYSRHRTGLQHLAFMMPTRASVKAVHDHVVAARGEVLFEPREFPEYTPPYFATFWLDPFGMMLEAVCHYDRD